MSRASESHGGRIKERLQPKDSALLPASAIERNVKAVEPFSFDRIYGAFWDMVIQADGKVVVKRSAEKYLRVIGR